MGPNVFERKIFLTNFWNKQKGSINLFTIRHDQGQIRHVFKPDSSIVNGVEPASPQGHSSISPVSVLTLDSIDESSFLSGGWDGRILVSLS
jgi:transcriptional activator SPT8